MDNTDYSSLVLQNAVDVVETWGIAMTINGHCQPWYFPAIEFAGVPVAEESHLKLLGVTIDF